jgi:hypothetical protein
MGSPIGIRDFARLSHRLSAASIRKSRLARNG